MSKSSLLCLIIGINEYPYTSKLEGSVSDARKMENYLRINCPEPLEYRPVMLFDDQATRDSIISQFYDHLIDQATAKDTCLFYFSGHGGREKAHKAFEEVERDGYLEGIVCYDSGRTANYKIADKELRHLIWKLSQKGCDIICIFDCCHSGGNTRMENGTEIQAKREANSSSGRPWKDFLFANEISEPGRLDAEGMDRLFPQGAHIQFAACEDKKLAYENRNWPGGYFTNALIKALESSKGNLSYIDLERRVKLELRTLGIDQDPQIYAPHGDRTLLFNRFLSGTREQSYLKGNVRYDTFNMNRGTWQLDLGGIHGVRKSEGDRANNIWVETEDKKFLKATIKEVFPSFSHIRFEDKAIVLDRNKAYPARIEGLMREPLYLEVNESGNTIYAQLKKDWKDKLAEQNIFLLADTERTIEQETLCYTLQSQNQKLILRRKSENQVIFECPNKLGENDFQELIDRLSQISQWHFLKNLNNPSSDFTQGAIEMEVTLPEGNTALYKSDGEPSRLTYLPPDSTEKLRIKVRFFNRSGRNLYLACMYMGSQYEILPTMLEPAVVELHEDPADRKNYVWANKGRNFLVSLPQHIIEANAEKEVVYFKLLLSTKPFSTDLFYMPPITEQAEREKELNRRGMVAEQVREFDWNGLLFTFEYKNPLHVP